MADREKDRRIEELERKVRYLTSSLKRIDDDVELAARKYLGGDRGQVLEFSEFLDLLVVEIRKQFSDKALVKKTLLALVRERLEEKIEALLPEIKGRLSDYLAIPIIILPRDYEIRDHLLVKTDMSYRAISVRGEALRSVGATPEEAYQETKRKIACRIFGNGPAEMAKQLALRDYELEKKWKDAKPFMTDDIEGFKVEVRLSNGSS